MHSARLQTLAGLLLAFAVTTFLGASAFRSSGAVQAQVPTATFIPSSRLDQPTLPAAPSQADEGAVDFWLNCMVCHGDRGQGLTEEFRMIYPPEEQNCWQSGCHGNRPYEQGFTLPGKVPPLIGDQADLNKFFTAAALQGFIGATMPWHNPGSLEQDVYWRLTAFLLRENGYANPFPVLNAENAAQVIVGGQQPTATSELATPQASSGTPQAARLAVVAGLALLLGGLLVALLRRVAKTRQ